MHKEDYSVGNIVFSTDGVHVTRKYDEGDFCVTPTPVSYEDLQPSLVVLCKARMEHCQKQLERNLHSATYANINGMIGWNGGHFSLPVYKRLKEFVDNNGAPAYFDALILQQCIRELYSVERSYHTLVLPKEFSKDQLFDILTEMALVDMAKNTEK